MSKKITLSRVMEALEGASSNLSDPGFCMACGEDAEGCEPDAREYKCESCGEDSVYGAAELLLYIIAEGNEE